ncbi:MAG TPA: DUF692 family protein [Actinomycetes bacterium]|nr:DUF692 family protein [Actinomycetes bacterium]
MRREPMPPGRWTALFFLDEATALAAGHRPCGYCRRGDYLAFADAWCRAHGLAERPRAVGIDARLHAERVDRRTRRQRSRPARAGELPDGVMVRHGGAVGLVAGGSLLGWSFGGYLAPLALPAGATVELLTPPATVATIGGRPTPGERWSPRTCCGSLRGASAGKAQPSRRPVALHRSACVPDATPSMINLDARALVSDRKPSVTRPCVTEPETGGDLGFGVGVRPALFAELLECDSGFDFFEVVTEDFLGVEGERRHVLHELAARSPIVMHGLSMSIAGSDALDIGYLSRLRELADDIGARWVSDHLCWTGVDGVHTHELLPVPYTESSLAYVSSRVLVAQDLLERSLVLENPSAYLTFEESTMSEPEFFGRLVEGTGCRLLLDVNNIYVSASNLGFDPMGYVDALPDGAVAQIHIAGNRNMGAYLIDSHDERVSQPVWDVYLHACRRLGPVSTSLEWDTQLPKLEVLREELGKAAELRSAAGLRPLPPPSMCAPPHDGPLTDVVADHGLARSQRALQAAILDGASQNAVPRKIDGELSLRPLSQVEGISIYGSAYRARHVDILRFAFPVLGELIGSELEDLALDYLAVRPVRTGSLERFTRLFAEWANDAFRLHRWAHVVRDVVALETTLMDLRLHTGTEGRVPLPASSIRFARHADVARMRFVANPCLRIMRLSEPSYIRSLSIRAGVALNWWGDASENVAILRRDFELHAIFLRRNQSSLLERLVDGVELGTAAVAESIDVSCAVEWSSEWAGAGILSDALVARPSAGSTASDAEA